MAWSYVNKKQTFAAASGTTVDALTFNVAAGDLLVAGVRWTGATTTCTVKERDDDSDQFTQLNMASTAVHTAWMGYKIGATSNATAVWRATLGANRTYRWIGVMQFRPDAGETVTLEASDFQNRGYTLFAHTVSTGNISPAGDDLCIVGALGSEDGLLSNHKIANADDDDQITTNSVGSLWYKMFAASQTNIDADIDIGGSGYSVIAIMAFKSVGVGAVTKNTRSWPLGTNIGMAFRMHP